MPRVIWSGSISFGLVHVPVGLYPGEQSDDLQLTLLDRRDLSPVGYKRYNKNTDVEVPYEDLVKGYEYEKGEYVVLGDEEFRRANVEANRTIEIVDFVSADAIPFIYYDKPYYLEPAKRGEKAYALLREILYRTKRVGIAKVVLRTRQHIAVLATLDRALVLNLLRYHHELRRPDELNLPEADTEALGITEKEIDLGKRLVESMVAPWQPESYHDEYRDDLMRVVEEKVAAGQTAVLEAPAAERPAAGAEIIDLMSLLKRSVAETEKARGKAKKPAARREPSKKRRHA